MLQEFVMLRLQEQFRDAEFFFQQDGAPPHFHRNVRTFSYIFQKSKYIN